jgi:hypothetical protein
MARWIVILIASTTIAAATACAGSGEEAAPAPVATAATANVETIITQLEREWVQAILAKDTAKVDRLLADDFIGTTDDTRYGKSEAVEDVTSGVHETLEITDVRVRPYGADVVVVTFDQSEKSRHGKEDFSGHYLFTNVWVNRAGEWRAVASHGNRLR